jgi:rhodanese-related sulfurtransferase
MSDTTTPADPLPLQIDVRELARWRDGGVVHAILDVREPWETEICLIPGSLCVPLGQIPTAADRIPGDRPVAVTCPHGMRSLQAVAWLRRNGYDNVTNLAGGVDAWARQIDPSMNVY